MTACGTVQELEEAAAVIGSATAKCEKAAAKLKQGGPQHTLAVRRLAAFYIAARLIDDALRGPDDAKQYSGADLGTARRTFEQLTAMFIELQERFKQGGPQHTLAVKRLRAFRIALCLIAKASGTYAGGC